MLRTILSRKRNRDINTISYNGINTTEYNKLLMYLPYFGQDLDSKQNVLGILAHAWWGKEILYQGQQKQVRYYFIKMENMGEKSWTRKKNKHIWSPTCLQNIYRVGWFTQEPILCLPPWPLPALLCALTLAGTGGGGLMQTPMSFSEITAEALGGSRWYFA